MYLGCVPEALDCISVYWGLSHYQLGLLQANWRHAKRHGVVLLTVLAR